MPHDRRLRLAAKKALTYRPVIFNGLQARACMRGVGDYVAKSNATMWAAAVMPDHFHLVMARRHYDIEYAANLLKGDAAKRLVAEGLHPFLEHQKADGSVPPCFGRKW